MRERRELAVLAMALLGSSPACYLMFSDSDSDREGGSADPCVNGPCGDAAVPESVEGDECSVDEDGDSVGACEDCDDHNPKVNPGTTDSSGPCAWSANGRDDNCNGLVDESADYEDVDCEGDRDGDGFDGSYGLVVGPDCDDADRSVHPGAHEAVCCRGNGIDDDCDGEVDEPDPAAGPCACEVDADADGWTVEDDCDDDDPAAHPAAMEFCCACPHELASEYPQCDGADNDCDGLVDETDLRSMESDPWCCVQ